MKSLLFLLTLGLYASHGYSVNGQLKYPPNFKHYDFVRLDAPFGGNLVVGELGTFEHITPFLSNVTRSGRLHLFDVGTLMIRAWDEPMANYCYCAESLEVSEDKRSVIFHIRKGVRWDKGYGDLTAADVAFSFRTWCQYGSLFTRSLYYLVKSVKVLDTYTVQFSFKEATPSLPCIVGEMPLLCKKFYDKHGMDALHKEPMIALGPYRIEAYCPGESVYYTYRSDFWGKNLPVMRGMANYASITVRYYQDTEVMRMALAKGDIDSMLERDPVYIASKYLPFCSNTHIKNYSWVALRPPIQSFIVINARKAYLKNWRVRKALYLMFRYDILGRYHFQGVYEPITSLFMKTVSQASEPASEEEKTLLKPFNDILPADIFTPFKHEGHRNLAGYGERVARAITLLKHAGWRIDEQRKSLVNQETGKSFPPLHIYCNGTKERLICSDFKKRLSVIGITLVIHDAAIPYLSHILGSHVLYDLGFFRYAGTQYPGLGLGASLDSRMANRKGSRNYAGVVHPAVDSLLDYIRSSQKLHEQVTAARALDRLIMHEYFFIPLFYSKKLTFWARDTILFPPFTKSAGYILLSSYMDQNKAKDSPSKADTPL